MSGSCLIVGDSSKIGIELEAKFASFEDEIQFVVDEDTSNAHLQELLARHKTKIVLA